METFATTVGDKATKWPTPSSTTSETPAIADLYYVSYLYYGCIGFAVTLIIGVLISLVTGKYEVCFKQYSL